MQGRPVWWRWGLVAVLLLNGCATADHRAPPKARGEASWHLVNKPGMVRYPLALGQVASGAEPFRRTAPSYPPSLLGSCPPPVEIQALLIVDQRGQVSAVRVAGGSVAGPSRQLFIAAVRKAAQQWQFTPLHLDQWAADAAGNSHRVDRETRPFSLTYRFRFACRAGHASVTTQGTDESR